MSLLGTFAQSMNGSGLNLSGESRNQSIRDKERSVKVDVGHLERNLLLLIEASGYYNRGPGHTADTAEHVSQGLRAHNTAEPSPSLSPYTPPLSPLPFLGSAKSSRIHWHCLTKWYQHARRERAGLRCIITRHPSPPI